jgi:putative membrane protein
MILALLINAAIIFALAYLMPQITIRNFWMALLAALLIGLFNATIGWILYAVFNVVTFGLLSFIIRLIVTALMIKLVDKLMRSFDVHGFWPAIVIAAVMAITSNFMDQRLKDDGVMDRRRVELPTEVAPLLAERLNK